MFLFCNNDFRNQIFNVCKQKTAVAFCMMLMSFCLQQKSNQKRNSWQDRFGKKWKRSRKQKCSEVALTYTTKKRKKKRERKEYRQQPKIPSSWTIDTISVWLIRLRQSNVILPRRATPFVFAFFAFCSRAAVRLCWKAPGLPSIWIYWPFLAWVERRESHLLFQFRTSLHRTKTSIFCRAPGKWSWAKSVVWGDVVCFTRFVALFLPGILRWEIV